MSNKNEDPASLANIQKVLLIIRPMYLDWQMGEDWELSVPITTTFADLKELIETEKGFSRHRINIKLKGKLLPANKEKWTIRRMGIYDGYILTVEATFPGSWWWNTLDYYSDKLLSQTEAFIDENGGGIYLTDLESKIILSPPIKTSLRVFLRKYPERIHIYCNTTDNSLWIEKTKDLISYPVFSPVPHTLGYFKHYQPKDIDWSQFKELDDRNQVIEYREEDRPKTPTIEIQDEEKELNKESQDISDPNRELEEQAIIETNKENQENIPEENQELQEHQISDDLQVVHVENSLTLEGRKKDQIEE